MDSETNGRVPTHLGTNFPPNTVLPVHPGWESSVSECAQRVKEPSDSLSPVLWFDKHFHLVSSENRLLIFQWLQSALHFASAHCRLAYRNWGEKVYQLLNCHLSNHKYRVSGVLMKVNSSKFDLSLTIFRWWSVVCWLWNVSVRLFWTQQLVYGTYWCNEMSIDDEQYRTTSLFQSKKLKKVDNYVGFIKRTKLMGFRKNLCWRGPFTSLRNGRWNHHLPSVVSWRTRNALSSS